MKRVISILLAIIIACVGLQITPIASDSETGTDEVIFYANPLKAGEVGANVTADGSVFDVFVAENDEDGAYYTSTWNVDGVWPRKDVYNKFVYFNSGLTSAELSWLGDAATLGALGGYITLSVDYRINATGYHWQYLNKNWGKDPHIYFGATNGQYYAKVDRAIFGNGWNTLNIPLSADHLANDILSSGKFFFRMDPYMGSESVTFVIDIRNIKITFNSANKDAINEALTATGSKWTYDELLDKSMILYDEYTLNFENGETFRNGVGSENFVLAESPDGIEGKYSFKHNFSDEDEYYRIKGSKLQKDCTYSVTFKYYAPDGEKSKNGYFDLVECNEGDLDLIKTNIPTKKNTWKAVSLIITPESRNEYLSLICRDEIYIDDFKVVNISNNSGTYFEDFSNSANSSTILEDIKSSNISYVYDDSLSKTVAKIEFSDTSDSSNGIVKLPFVFEKDATYRVRFKYKSNDWHGVYFNHKFGSENGFYNSDWSIKTYYVKGSENADLFGFGTNKGNTVLWLAEVSIEKAKGMGDINNDEEVDSVDLVLLRSLLLGIENSSIFECSADINEDNTVDIGDLVRMKKRLINTKVVPKAVTLSFYDQTSYGVTWNTEDEPGKTVVQISLGESFNNADYMEFDSVYTEETTYLSDNTEYKYFVSKSVLTGLEKGKTYTYRCYDKEYGVSSGPYTFTASDRESSSFKFIHVGDSQSTSSASVDPNNEGIGTGVWYANAMSAMEKNNVNPDFILHTGDIVEWGKYESYWHNMIETNSKYFSGIPVMPIGGNHEGNYNRKNGSKEIYKHFNINIPNQDVTKGMYYTFVHGNTRFIMLNTNLIFSETDIGDQEQVQYDWLVNVLKNKTEKWTIVSIHYPMYSAGQSHAQLEYIRERLTNLFAEYGVDLVLQGHDHVYSKTYPIGLNGIVNTSAEYENINGIQYCTNANGVIYAMHGPAGNGSRSVANPDDELFEMYGNSKASSWSEIEVENNLLTVKVYYSNNGSPVLWNSYGIKKP